MNKILIAAAAAFLAVTTLFGSGAQAGFNVRLSAPAGFSTVEKAGCGGGYSSYKKRRYSSIKRAKRKAYLAAKRKAAARRIAAKKAAARRIAANKAAAAKAARLAKAEEAKADAQVALAPTPKAENSSIATGGKVAKAESEPKAEKQVAAAQEPGCKQFFPSVGMTLSVPCQ